MIRVTRLCSCRVPAGLPPSRDWGALARLVFSAERFRHPAEVTLNWVTPMHIRRLNRQFRRVDRETDVISFRQDLAGTPTPRTARRAGPRGLEGDIAINVSLARRQARQAGHSLAREMRLLWIHGLLHLLGYSDYDPAARRKMFARQAQLLNRWERQRG